MTWTPASRVRKPAYRAARDPGQGWWMTVFAVACASIHCLRSCRRRTAPRRAGREKFTFRPLAGHRRPARAPYPFGRSGRAAASYPATCGDAKGYRVGYVSYAAANRHRGRAPAVIGCTLCPPAMLVAYCPVLAAPAQRAECAIGHDRSVRKRKRAGTRRRVSQNARLAFLRPRPRPSGLSPLSRDATGRTTVRVAMCPRTN